MNSLTEASVINANRLMNHQIGSSPRRVVRSKRIEPTNNARTDYLLAAFVVVMSMMLVFVTFVAVQQHQAMRDMASRSYQQLVCYDAQGRMVMDDKGAFAVCEKVTIIRHKRDTLVLD